jgi:ESCRT-II complex subunit VPS36
LRQYDFSGFLKEDTCEIRDSSLSRDIALAMNTFVLTTLSSAGRVVFYEDEVEIKSETEGVHVFSQKGTVIASELFEGQLSMLTLTNMRIIVLTRRASSAGLTAWAVPLSSVEFVEDCAQGVLRRSTRIRICIGRKVENRDNEKHLKSDIGLGFERGGIGLDDNRKNNFLRLLQQALTKRSWEELDAKNKEAQRREAAAKGISYTATPSTCSTPIKQVNQSGIGGILQKHQDSLVAASALTKEATQDLATLMERAKDVVNMVDKFSKYASSSSSNRDMQKGSINKPAVMNDDSNSDDDISSVLLSIGMINPVTKTSTGGGAYYEQLARQIGDLLSTDNRLEKMGGMVTLTDLYCIYNRARGTSLVSPEDLRSAVASLEALNLGMKLISFKSGVLVVQSNSLSEQAICTRILSLYNGDKSNSSYDAQVQERSQGISGLQATDVSKLLKLPLQVSKEQLYMAERRGVLCRDESEYGITFYKNLLLTEF